MKLAIKGPKGAIVFRFCAFCASLGAVDSVFRFAVLSVKAPPKPVAKCDHLRPQFELDAQIAQAEFNPADLGGIKSGALEAERENSLRPLRSLAAIFIRVHPRLKRNVS